MTEEEKAAFEKLREQQACANGMANAYPKGLDHSDRGLTKRELFAAFALQGLLSNPSTTTCFNTEAAVAAADALLAALEK